MKLTLHDLNVIVDTLIGSQSIADGGTLFKYTAEGRLEVGLKVIDVMGKINIDLEIEKKEKNGNEP